MPLSGSKLLLYAYLESIDDTGLPADGCDIELLESQGFVRTSVTGCVLTPSGRARLEKLRDAQRLDMRGGNARSPRDHCTDASRCGLTP